MLQSANSGHKWYYDKLSQDHDSSPDSKDYNDCDITDNIHHDLAKKTSQSHGLKPQAADYEGLTNSVLLMAMAEFQVCICTENTFLSDDESEAWVHEC